MMDPSTALQNARDAALAILTLDYAVDTEKWYEAVEKLGESFTSLDQWLSSGGFLPKAWASTNTEKRL